MKNRLFIKILLVLLFVAIAPTAYAADGQNSQVITADIAFHGSEIAPSIYSDCRKTDPANVNTDEVAHTDLPGCTTTEQRQYHTWKITMQPQGSGEKYPAFCLYPGRHGTTSMGAGATCNLLTTDDVPMLYYLADNHYDLIENNFLIADLVYRITGAAEKQGAGMNDSSSQDENILIREQMFQSTYRLRVVNPEMLDRFDQYQGFVLHDFVSNETGPYFNEDGKRDEDGLIKQATTYIREAYDHTNGGTHYDRESDETTDINNNRFELIPDVATLDAGSSTQEYTIRSKNGEVIPCIEVTALEGQYSWVREWDGTSAKIKVTALSHGDKCTAKIKIKATTTCNNNLSATKNATNLDTGLAINTDNNGVVSLANNTAGEGAKIFYCTLAAGANAQSYIGIIKGNLDYDVIDLEIPCSCESNPGPGTDGACTPAAKPIEFKEQEVHNCCEEGASSFGTQYALKELFCNYNHGGMTIKEYKEKCNTEEYKDTDDTTNINSNTVSAQYCSQYCSSSFEYKLPGPTHSKQDTFFKFSKSKLGYSGPILNQYKRCRTIIKYNEWYNAYVSNVEAEISSYNTAQYNYAKHKLWEKMISDNLSYTERQTATCSRSCSGTDAQGRSYSHSAGSSSQEVTGTIRKFVVGDYWHDSNGQHNKIAREHDDQAGRYTYSKIKYAGTQYLENERGNVYYEKSTVEAFEQSYSSAITSLTNGLSSCNSNETPSTSCSSLPDGFLSQRVNSTEVMNTYKNTADQAIDSFNDYVQRIIELKKGLDTCSGRITEDGKIDQPLINRVKFKAEPEMTFSYTSKFVQDDGSLADQVSYIPFVKVDPNGKCDEEYRTGFKDGAGYDENYRNGSEYYNDNYDTTTYRAEYSTITDLGKYESKEKDTIYTGAPSNFTCAKCHIASNNEQPTEDEDGLPTNDYYNGRVYYASKKFTTDAMGHMTCKWKEDGASKRHVLVPSGVIIFEPETAGRLCEDTNYNCVVLNKDGDTYINDGIYHTFKSHLEGKFETYFTLSNIADGLFDDVLSKGETCSEHPNEEIIVKTANGEHASNATCYIEIQANLQEYLSCSGEKVLSKDEAAKELCCQNPPCDKESPTMLFDYKVVDTTNMFPNKNEYVGGYAHNWLVDADGKKEYEEMTKDGNEDKTYAPENLTYSFTLTPRDLRAIREYNKSRIPYGGYSDFNLYCDGNGGDQPLTKCKSRFIEAISGGIIDDGTYNLSIKTNNMDLNEVRNNW